MADGGKAGRQILEAAAAGIVKALVVMGGSLWADDVAPLVERVAASAEVAGGHRHPARAAEPRGDRAHPRPRVLREGGDRHQRRGARPAHPARAAAGHADPTETRILSALAAELGAGGWPGDPLQVNRELVAAIPAYRLAGNGGRAIFEAAGRT